MRTSKTQNKRPVMSAESDVDRHRRLAANGRRIRLLVAGLAIRSFGALSALSLVHCATDVGNPALEDLGGGFTDVSQDATDARPDFSEEDVRQDSAEDAQDATASDTDAQQDVIATDAEVDADQDAAPQDADASADLIEDLDANDGSGQDFDANDGSGNDLDAADGSGDDGQVSDTPSLPDN